MTIRELKLILDKFDDGLQVLVSSDEEGNSINYLRKVELEKMLEGDYEFEFIDEDESYDGEDYLILWP